MTSELALAEQYSRARPRLTKIAYAVLGSSDEAEDVVSDCWLSLVRADARDPVLDVEAWSTVAVARRALDSLRSARRRRETYVGPWLPEPVVSRRQVTTDPADPADRVSLDETIGFALMVVLETLTPAERTAWVLHDVFAVPFDEIADAVGRTPGAVRQLASRARKHITAGAPRVGVDRAAHDAVVEAFSTAATSGDLRGLLALLDPDVVLTSDGGGEVSAALRPVVGSARVARFVLGIARKFATAGHPEVVTVNGAAGLATFRGSQLDSVVSLTVAEGTIVRVDLVRAPSKLPSLLSSRT